MRGQPATRISLRGHRSAPLSRWPRLSPEELGPRARETNWHATRQSRGPAQARGHHASDLERSERIPLDGDTIDYRLRAIPEGNSFSSEWSALYERVMKLTGGSSARNLLAHAVIRQEVITKQGPISSSGFLGLMETAISYRVEQDAALLLAGQRKARAADLESLLAYCQDIISVLSDLDSFLAKLP
jgi:hypothetical protein